MLKAIYLFPSMQSIGRVNDNAFLYPRIPFVLCTSTSSSSCVDPSPAEIGYQVSDTVNQPLSSVYKWEIQPQSTPFVGLTVFYAGTITQQAHPYINVTACPSGIGSCSSLSSSFTPTLCFTNTGDGSSCVGAAVSVTSITSGTVGFHISHQFAAATDLATCRSSPPLRIQVLSPDISCSRTYFLFSLGCAQYFSPRDLLVY